MSETTCMINLNAEDAAKGVDLCGEPAIYAAWTENCNICWLMDFPRCTGHPVCVKHGAELRAELLRDGPERAEIQRLSSLPQEKHWIAQGGRQ